MKNTAVSEASLNTVPCQKEVVEVPRVSTESLFGKSRTLVVEHEGESYLLRITRKSKLILTK